MPVEYENKLKTLLEEHELERSAKKEKEEAIAQWMSNYPRDQFPFGSSGSRSPSVV